MARERSRYGLMFSALGAILLAVSVFLPWYGLSFTANGIGVVQQVGDQVASQLGNATMQSYMSGLHANLGGLAGQEFTAVSAMPLVRQMRLYRPPPTLTICHC